jgi:hypothetical protein
MSTPIPSEIVAWWGGTVSSILAIVRLWETWRDRFRVEVSANLTSLPEIGNEVLIRNLGTRAFILTYWQLLYGSSIRPFRKFEHLASPDYDEGDRKVEPFETCTLPFMEDNHFDWGVDALAGRDIYIRLCIAGRRPRLKLVYRFPSRRMTRPRQFANRLVSALMSASRDSISASRSEEISSGK